MDESAVSFLMSETKQAIQWRRKGWMDRAISSKTDGPYLVCLSILKSSSLQAASHEQEGESQLHHGGPELNRGHFQEEEAGDDGWRFWFVHFDSAPVHIAASVKEWIWWPNASPTHQTRASAETFPCYRPSSCSWQTLPWPRRASRPCGRGPPGGSPKKTSPPPSGGGMSSESSVRSVRIGGGYVKKSWNKLFKFLTVSYTCCLEIKNTHYVYILGRYQHVNVFTLTCKFFIEFEALAYARWCKGKERGCRRQQVLSM